MLATLLTLVSLLVETTDDALAPWASNHHPTDVREAARSRDHRRDGLSTSSSRAGRWTAGTADRPRASGNRSSKRGSRTAPSVMENVGRDRCGQSLALQRPTTISAALEQIVARAVKPGMTDGEKARALWWQEVQLSLPPRRGQ